MTYGDLQTLIYQLTRTNSTSLPAATLNVYTQPAEDRVAALIMASDSRWQFDDSNNADLPIATTQLVANQQDYSLATSHLTIDRVEIKDTSGNWKQLTPIDQHDIRNEALGAHLSTPGTPLQYDKLGTSVFLYPVPSYTQAASLKLYFTRGPLKFDFSTSKFTDGTGSITSSPGYNSLFHELIALLASRRYAVANGLSNSEIILKDIMLMEQHLASFYGQRSHDERPRMGVSTNGGSGNMSGQLSSGSSDSNR